MFIGREAELKFLNNKYNEKTGQLIVLYGRRRIGKTETLREFCKGKPHVFFSCTQVTDKIQLARFSSQILREGVAAGKYISEFEDWEKAFKAVSELPYGDKKKLVIIDEFPYMCRGNSSIPSVLQNIWDLFLKDENVMLVLCGSAMSFIEKELLAEKNPLYGRATGIYKMTPMGFYDAMKFFPGYSDKDKVIAYAVLGGIPHYLKQWNPDFSVSKNIKENTLAKGCVLYSETEFLLHQELRETAVYNAIIGAVALGSTSINEISQKSLVASTSKTSIYLKNLTELGIAGREFSVDIGIKKQSNANKGIYRLTDNFFRFWYAFGFANYSQLEDGDADGVYKYIVEPALHEYAAYAFENICMEFVKELQKKDMLPFRYSRLGRWWGKTTVRDENAPDGLRMAESELDILGISEDAKKYLAGECKFKNTVFRYSEYLDVLAKLTPQKKNAKFYYMLFSESGFDSRIKEEAGEHLRLYSLEEIVNYKE